MAEAVDLGDREAPWHAWCLVSRCAPDPDQPKIIHIPFGPHHGKTLQPCNDANGMRCSRHGMLQGSLNEISTNGTAFAFRDDRWLTVESSIEDAELMQQAMMVSRERSRENNDKRVRSRKKPSKDVWLNVIEQYQPLSPLHKPFLSAKLRQTTYTPQQKHRAARANRVALSLREESSRISGGKYKPLTFMGLPSEIHLLIFEAYFRDMAMDSSKLVVESVQVPYQISNSRFRGELTKCPLAILQTSRLLYSEGLRMFRRNALFLSEFEPVKCSMINDQLGYDWCTKLQRPWPELKRWKLRVISPDQGESWSDGRLAILATNENAFSKLLTPLVKLHLSVAFSNNNVLDELVLDLGHTTKLYGGNWETLLMKLMRMAIMKGLIPYSGKVKKMRIIGTFPDQLKDYARLMEIFVQQNDDTPAGCESPLGAHHKGHIEAPEDPKDPEEVEEDDWDGASAFSDSDSGDFDFEPPVEVVFFIDVWIASHDPHEVKLPLLLKYLATFSPDVLKEYGLTDGTPPLNRWISIIPVTKCMLPEQNVKFNGPGIFDEAPSPQFLQWPNSDLELAAKVPLPQDHMIELVLLDPNNFPDTCSLSKTDTEKEKELICLKSLIESLLSLHESYYQVEFPPSPSKKQVEPAFLLWPNSDLELAAKEPLPAEPIDLPLVGYIKPSEPNMAPLLYRQVRVNFDFSWVVVGNVMNYSKIADVTGDWHGPHYLPLSVAPPAGLYRLVGINGLPYTAPLEVIDPGAQGPTADSVAVVPPMQEESVFSAPEENPLSSVGLIPRENEEQDPNSLPGEVSNINLEYDGPEDDGLAWLDEQVFDLDQQDGEWELEKYDEEWKELRPEVRFGAAL